MPSTKLRHGQGGADAIAISRNGKRAVVLQGDVYGSNGLLTLDITRSPARVVGTNTSIKANGLSRLVVRGNHYAYTTSGNAITVSEFHSGRAKIRKRVHLGTGDGIYDLAITPNGKWLYAAHGAGYGDANLAVLKVNKHGIPKKVHTWRHRPISRLAVTPNGNKLLITGGHKLHTFNISKAHQTPHQMGKGTGLKEVKPDRIAVTRGGHYAYVFDAGAVGVTKVNLHSRHRMKHRTLATYDFGGDLAVSADGRRVLVLNGHEGDGAVAGYLLKSNLKTARTMTGACYPSAAAASWSGPTRSRFYLADGGICSNQARFTPLRRK